MTEFFENTVDIEMLPEEFLPIHNVPLAEPHKKPRRTIQRTNTRLSLLALAEKQQAKEQAKLEKEQAKKLAKEQAKLEKEQAKQLAKEQAKLEKELAKQQAKLEKEQAKQQAKLEKLRLKEQAKLEKEQAKQQAKLEKLQAKQQEKLAKKEQNKRVNKITNKPLQQSDIEVVQETVAELIEEPILQVVAELIEEPIEHVVVELVQEPVQPVEQPKKQNKNKKNTFLAHVSFHLILEFSKTPKNIQKWIKNHLPIADEFDIHKLKFTPIPYQYNIVFQIEFDVKENNLQAALFDAEFISNIDEDGNFQELISSTMQPNTFQYNIY
jgi:hypothetical protein